MPSPRSQLTRLWLRRPPPPRDSPRIASHSSRCRSTHSSHCSSSPRTPAQGRSSASKRSTSEGVLRGNGDPELAWLCEELHRDVGLGGRGQSSNEQGTAAQWYQAFRFHLASLQWGKISGSDTLNFRLHWWHRVRIRTCPRVSWKVNLSLSLNWRFSTSISNKGLINH